MNIRHGALSLFVCVATLLLFSVSASAQTSEWTFCASEGRVCAFSGTQHVRYGANGAFVYRSLSDGIFCSNSVFGDPAPGAVKQCATSSTTTNWSFCAVEGGVCAFSGTQQVRYGANGLYVYRTLSDGIFCWNSVFGDPVPGMVKQCSIGGTASAPPSAPSPPPPSADPTYGPRAASPVRRAP